MLDGKNTSRFCVASYIVSSVINLFCAEKVTPLEINPYKSPYSTDDENSQNQQIIDDGQSGIKFLLAHAEEMGIKVVNHARE